MSDPQHAPGLSSEQPTGITRRSMVVTTALAGLALGQPVHSAMAQTRATSTSPASPADHLVTHKESPMFAYVGSRTTRERNARGDGITVYQVSPQTGALTQVQVLDDLVNPSYLAFNSDKTRLYTVHGDLDYVSAFARDPSSGTLRFINRQSTQGNNPVHLALDPSGRHLVVSNHLSGSLAVLPIGLEGELQPLSQLVHLEGPLGPHRIEQNQVKPHFNGFDPSGQYVVVPDKGLDRVFTFRFDNGRLQPAAQPFVTTRECAGPRHHVFHPTQNNVYVVNELDSSVTAYTFDVAKGALSAFQRVSTLPDTYTGDSRASGIMVAPDGKTLYASNRGHDSIAIFAIDPSNGHLRFVDAISTQGSKPRFFTLNPEGSLLYALNEDSHAIVTFAVDATTGRLTRALPDQPCGSPVCMVFA